MRDLTDDEIKEISNSFEMGEWPSDFCAVQFARAILDAAWIKTQGPLKDGE